MADARPDRPAAVTFDCYGTLIDWESGILAALQPVLASHEVTAGAGEILAAYARAEMAVERGPYVSYREVLRRSFLGLAKDLGFAPRPDEVETLVHALPTWDPFPDTLESLRRLDGRFPLGIVSNVDEDLLAATLERLPVRFSWLITAEAARAYKPSPRIFEDALTRIGAPAAEVVHAAQSRYHDVAPARRLGLWTVHVVRDSGRDGPRAVPETDVSAHETVADLAGLARVLLG